MSHTCYNHFTDDELIRLAEREPLSDELRHELVTRLLRMHLKVEALREQGHCASASDCDLHRSC